MILRTLLAGTLATLTSCAPSVPPQTLEARDGLACDAYVVAGREPVTDVFLSMGGTGTGSIAFVPEAMRDVLRTKTAAFVTFDKPGVHASFGDPASVRIDDEPFHRHTQGTILECAERAIALAERRFGPNVRWHLRGHSEGALIALYLLDDLLQRRPALAERIETLVLSGLPLEPFDELTRRQLSTEPMLAQATERCDWSVMKHTGVSCAYIEDAKARPSGSVMFERLASRRSKARVFAFAGNYDANTPARFVRRLEEWNTADGHLDLKIRYYDGGHTGTPEVRRELSELLVGLVGRR